jgi:hypothetical protein
VLPFGVWKNILFLDSFHSGGVAVTQHIVPKRGYDFLMKLYKGRKGLSRQNLGSAEKEPLKIIGTGLRMTCPSCEEEIREES